MLKKKLKCAKQVNKLIMYIKVIDETNWDEILTQSKSQNQIKIKLARWD
ncbi:hypothetical protein HYE04_00920 [Mycoplasmopsis bovis]|nr:hypothetical protein [Mycoplasmopsis bovis]QQH27751.1 hypothetical protein HYE04_00920 [Mycoplasmopsis bovis]